MGPLLNPDTYLNHLSPGQAAQFEVVKIVQVASLGAIIWDVFSFIPEDIKVLRQGGGVITLACFTLIRLLAVAYVASWVIMSTHPVANCQRLLLGSNIACAFLMAITSFLFLRRAQAVYTGSRLAYWLFALLFVGSCASHVVPVFGMTSEHIPGTEYCVMYQVELSAMVTYFMPEAFDTMVFFAISYKIAYQDHQHHPDLMGNPITRFLSSKYLPTLSRALLQGGQQYYLIGIIFRLVAVVLMFTPSVPRLYRPLGLLPSVVVASSTACRVHRLVVLAYYDSNGDGSNIHISHIRFVKSNPTAGRPLSYVLTDIVPVSVDTQV